jgi:AGZA family xanthine/uracil permease-like MFS transporter
LKNGGLIVASDDMLTKLGPWSATSLLAVAGIILAGVLIAAKVRGALFFTIVIITVVGIPFGVTPMPEDFILISMPQSLAPIALKMDFTAFLTFDINYYVAVFTLLFMDMFDTLGTLIGTSTSAGMVDPKTGHIHGLNRALMADAIGTIFGALCGTNTVTTYVESTTGVAEGGRTGLTAFTVAILFLVALFFSPLFLIIPSAATTSAMVLVGVLMIESITKIDFTDITEAVPCFMMILTMPFTGSISDGVVLGLLSYVLVKVCTGHYKEISVVMYILAFFFLLKYIFN